MKPLLRWHLRARRAAGLTLLEVVMTVAVLGVLGALALPQVGAQLDRQRLRDAAQTLAGDIAEARILAAQRGQAMHLLGRPGDNWCWSVAFEPGCGCDGGASRCAVHVSKAADHPGVGMLQPLALDLDPGGQALASGSTTFESPNGERLRVEVSLLGRPRICAAAGRWPQIPDCSTP
jgi:type IV fimbrial biogenesis protein FimT